MFKIPGIKCLEAKVREKSYHDYSKFFITFFKLKQNCLQKDNAAALAISGSATVGVKAPPPLIYAASNSILKTVRLSLSLLKSHYRAFNVKLYRLQVSPG